MVNIDTIPSVKIPCLVVNYPARVMRRTVAENNLYTA